MKLGLNISGGAFHFPYHYVATLVLSVLVGLSIFIAAYLATPHTTFRLMMNGRDYGNFAIWHVNVADGIDENEARRIVEQAFERAKSENPDWFGAGYYRIQTINLDDQRYIFARIVWGMTSGELTNPTPYNDFDVTVDIAQRTITVVYPVVSP